MAEPTEERIREALRAVQDPELHRDLVSLGMVKEIAVGNGTANVTIELTTPACPLRNKIREDVERAVRSVPGVTAVHVEMTARVRAPAGPLQLPGVKNVVAVGAGKGGVGKSTVAVLAAVGLARAGAAVGILDADVYGPSIPKMLGIEDAKPTLVGEKMAPVRAACGVAAVSMGLLVDPNRAIIWRGPMVHNALRQFLQQVEWGQLDYLIVDLPPGTGDAALSLAQSIPVTGAVVVCTPQPVALADAVRALKMYQQLGVEILGLVENMSYYICPHCGGREEIFGHGGAEQAARELQVPFLGAIPIHTGIRLSGDEGKPLAAFDNSNPKMRDAIQGFVGRLAGQITIRNTLKPPPQALQVGSPPPREP